MADIIGRRKVLARKRRHRRVRRRISGTAARPRMNVYRSNRNTFVQVIDDVAGRTLVSCSTIDRELASRLGDSSKLEAAKLVGQKVAERAKAAGIKAVVFDRGGFTYTGRVAAVAQAAREAGLQV
ncbi:MAG: 50S ribosomal protein L18 [Chloroflexi bacterium]|nr:50S ribosomal protein L18 [Chloroflexota bacterium]MCY3581057.1 50S ribosomal protein L18 [Chloroflexota bacterium]MCY3715246.1 50S ribosomal protein L18 [Chloroflexota bacterium]MXV93747.1 50S ribosomal protein L18 [Chloroflexota bacterium]MXX50194.1 50S ribosomal protein L18 [Chloroflexota bacterium]